MKFILNDTGMGCTYNTTRGRVYTSTETKLSAGTVYFRNDCGDMQQIGDKCYTEVPKGAFVGLFINALPSYEAKVGDYAVFEPDHDPQFYKRTGGISNPFVMSRDVQVVEDPWNVIGPKGPKGAQGDRGRCPLDPHELTEENRLIIKRQKAIAVEVLQKAMLHDGDVFIGGGAPRNWEFNLPAKDLDVFVVMPRGYSAKHCEVAMRQMGITNIVNLSTHNPDGTLRNSSEARSQRKQCRVNNITYVLEGDYQGERVQFIYLSDSNYTRLSYMNRYFDTSINMIMATLDGDNFDTLKITQGSSYKQGMKSGVIFYQAGRDSYGTDHLLRILKYFPNVPVIDIEKQSEVIKYPERIDRLDMHKDLLSQFGELEF